MRCTSREKIAVANWPLDVVSQIHVYVHYSLSVIEMCTPEALSSSDNWACEAALC